MTETINAIPLTKLYGERAGEFAPNHHTFLIPSTLYKSNRRNSLRDRSRVILDIVKGITESRRN